MNYFQLKSKKNTSKIMLDTREANKKSDACKNEHKYVT